MNEYDPKGGYVKGMSITEKYNTWAAAQYREKVGWVGGHGSSLKWGKCPVRLNDDLRVFLARSDLRRSTSTMVSLRPTSVLQPINRTRSSQSNPQVSIRRFGVPSVRYQQPRCVRVDWDQQDR
jgi:hypothetical protein